MKKGIFAALFLVTLASASFAQTSPKKEAIAQKKEAKAEKKEEKKDMAKHHHGKHHAGNKKAEGTK